MFVGVACLAEPASAFCRSTTCKGGECPRDDDGCKTSGSPLFWKSSCVGFSVQKDGTQLIALKYVRQTIEKSFLTWTDLACEGGTASISFSELADVSCHQIEYNASGANANVILFQDNKWDYSGVDNTLGRTTVTFDDSGEILDADIEINHAYNDVTVSDDEVAYDLESILTHEIGHFIGLDHSLDLDATMNAAYEPGSIEFRTIEADDVAGACAIYAPERAARCETTPHGGLSDACGGETKGETGGCSVALPDDTGGLGALVALSGLLASRLRRRSR